MRRVLLAVVLVFVALVVIGYALPDSREGNPAVYDRIDRMTDCAELQREFDIADRNGNTDYMQAADDRMRKVGCYG